jgi:hypothetical protein
MTRILADLPDDDIKWLDRIAVAQAKLRAAVLPVIIRWYRQHIEGSQ